MELVSDCMGEKLGKTGSLKEILYEVANLILCNFLCRLGKVAIKSIRVCNTIRIYGEYNLFDLIFMRKPYEKHIVIIAEKSLI